MTRIINVSIIKPEYHYATEEIIEAMDIYWLSKLDDEQFRRKSLKILRAADINSRNSIATLETVFSDITFEERNNIYIKAMIELGEKVLKKSLKEANMKAEELDYIITTSCTGFMIPSVDAYLVERVGLRKDIVRLPVTEMGCAGGTAGLSYAHEFLKSNPGKKAALLCLEAPSVTFQKNDVTIENVVSTAIFADGASCVLLGGEGSGPHIQDSNTFHFPLSTHYMGYNLQNDGLKIVLDRVVPSAISDNFENLFYPFLKKNNLKPADIENYMFHPGGKKIINMVEKFISQFDKDISDSKNILQEHGNMSSSTIIHILKRFMDKEISKGEKGYMLAFGPGFMAQSLLLEWK